MSKISISRILENAEEQKKQEEKEEYEKYILNLKIGDLIDVPGSALICGVAFAKKATSYTCPLMNIPDAKHVIDDEDNSWEIANSLFVSENTYPSIILEKVKSIKCSCSFYWTQHTLPEDIIVLIKERLFYVRLPNPFVMAVTGM